MLVAGSNCNVLPASPSVAGLPTHPAPAGSSVGDTAGQSAADSFASRAPSSCKGAATTTSSSSEGSAEHSTHVRLSGTSRFTRNISMSSAAISRSSLRSTLLDGGSMHLPSYLKGIDSRSASMSQTSSSGASNSLSRNYSSPFVRSSVGSSVGLDFHDTDTDHEPPKVGLVSGSIADDFKRSLVAHADVDKASLAFPMLQKQAVIDKCNRLFDRTSTTRSADSPTLPQLHQAVDPFSGEKRKDGPPSRHSDPLDRAKGRSSLPRTGSAFLSERSIEIPALSLQSVRMGRMLSQGRISNLELDDNLRTCKEFGFVKALDQSTGHKML